MTIRPLLIDPMDFKRNAAEIRQRSASGEDFAPEALADLLGLDRAFVVAAVAVGMALKSGQPVLISPLGTIDEAAVN